MNFLLNNNILDNMIWFKWYSNKKWSFNFRLSRIPFIHWMVASFHTLDGRGKYSSEDFSFFHGTDFILQHFSIQLLDFFGIFPQCFSFCFKIFSFVRNKMQLWKLKFIRLITNIFENWKWVTKSKSLKQFFF